MTSCLSSNYEKSYEQKTAWVYLINLGFYFIPLYFMAGQWLKISIAIALLVPFIISYFWAYNSPKEHVLKPIVLMVVTAITSSFFSSGAISLFSFCCFFIGLFYSLRTAILSFLVLSILLFVIDIIMDYPSYFFTFYGMGICLGVGVFGVIEQNRQRIKRQQQQSKDEIANLATALERERIGRDLHDVMGHHLAAIALKAELADKFIASGKIDLAQQQIHQVSVITRDCLSQIRHTVSNYKHQGLTHTLNTLANTLRDNAIAVSIEGTFPKLSELMESQISLLLTELINNTIKHSQATHCTLHIEASQGWLKLNFIENAPVKAISEGNGLTGIQERITLLHGIINYQLIPHYKVSIQLPLSEPVQ
ncbi:sensor histidine kinase [Shewanella sp. A14]